jgi:hypothetical protein
VSDLTFVCCAFNEARQLPMMLATLPRGARVVVIDGAYRSFPHEVPWSTDGTLEIAERFGCEVVRVDRPWDDQVAKRTVALAYGTVFIIDADELLTGVPVPDRGDCGWVEICNPTLYGDSYRQPRLFHAGPGWHYGGRHHWVYDAAGRLVAGHGQPGESFHHYDLPVMLHNVRHWRDPERLAAKTEYQFIQRREELVNDAP